MSFLQEKKVKEDERQWEEFKLRDQNLTKQLYSYMRVEKYLTWRILTDDEYDYNNLIRIYLRYKDLLQRWKSIKTNASPHRLFEQTFSPYKTEKDYIRDILENIHNYFEYRRINHPVISVLSQDDYIYRGGKQRKSKNQRKGGKSKKQRTRRRIR